MLTETDAQAYLANKCQRERLAAAKEELSRYSPAVYTPSVPHWRECHTQLVRELELILLPHSSYLQRKYGVEY